MLLGDEYDHVTGKWSKFPDMINVRGAFEACVVNGAIYIVGSREGYGMYIMSRDIVIDVFDGVKWDLLDFTMPEPVRYDSCVCFEGTKLLVFDNRNGSRIYDTQTKEWTEGIQSREYHLKYFAAVSF